MQAAPQRAGDLTRASREGPATAEAPPPAQPQARNVPRIRWSPRAACVPARPPIGATPISIAVACRAMALGALGWLGRYLGRMFRATRQKQELIEVTECFFFFLFFALKM